jgi:uncharacterized protein (TIGR02145 family)
MTYIADFLPFFKKNQSCFLCLVIIIIHFIFEGKHVSIKNIIMKKLFPIIILFLNFSLTAQDVAIGSQIWTSKNLDVEKYRNGDAIPQVQDAAAWANLKTGAWCYYENKTENGTIYGKLYNWYAINDPRGLAPLGYHIPVDAEWVLLLKNLSIELAVNDTEYDHQDSEKAKLAAKKMKSSNGWKYNDSNANSSGFTALPGGKRGSDGSFLGIGERAHWGTITSAPTGYYFYSIYNQETWPPSGVQYILKVDWRHIENDGFSVRCIKDLKTSF